MPSKAKSSSAALAPRKSPSQERSGHTVAVLIEAAAQVLETVGLQGYNTNAVAERAGVSIGSLYQYFRNKDALTVALMQREDAWFQSDGAAALQASSGREAMEQFIDAAVRQQLARPVLARLLDVEESRPEIQRAVEGATNFRALLEAVLASSDMPRQARPGLAALDVAALIRALTDGAGERGETDTSDLKKRISAAVFGYLDAMEAPEAVPNASKSRRKAPAVR